MVNGHELAARSEKYSKRTLRKLERNKMADKLRVSKIERLAPLARAPNV
jgi:hypothetical protein